MARHGPDKEVCGAQRANQAPGVLCQNVAGERTEHLGVGRCYLHGGSTATHNKAAQVELARRECDRLGILIEVDPAEALITAVWRAQGNLAYYEAQVARLDDVITGETGPAGAFKQTAHPLVVLYHEAEKWAANVAVAALRAGVEERRVRMAERDAAQVFGAVGETLSAMGLLDRFDEFRGHFANALSGDYAGRPQGMHSVSSVEVVD
jgi:hypothetical protein